MDFIQKYWIYGLGFFAQALFGSRLLVQLFYSERAGKVVSPTLFWQISLLASFLFLVYGILRDDVVIIVGQLLSYCIYIRNLQLKNDWQRFHLSVRICIVLLPILAMAWILFLSDQKLNQILQAQSLLNPIVFVGMVGQLLLNLRFIYQWYYSERLKASVLPLGFWVISTVASVLVIAYAIYRHDPVLLLAQGLGIFVYIRNMIIFNKSVN